MSTEIKSPTFPESVVDGTVANWLKKEGETVKQDEVIAEIETDKVVLEVVAPFDGSITKIYKQAGETVTSAELIADFSEGSSPDAVKESKTEERKQDKNEDKKSGPAAKKIMNEHDLDAAEVSASGKGGRITKADVLEHLETRNSDAKKDIDISTTISGDRPEERVPMSRLRATIAKRLLEVKQNTAMLTTFNEVDMLPIKNMRSKFGTEFEEKHGVKLGFMSFFCCSSC